MCACVLHVCACVLHVCACIVCVCVHGARGEECNCKRLRCK
uniref:EGF-like domain-containing protein n=1 Tax=Anguilla anguilla TaxID=7936 RepID=A0A0E9S4B4_ANGAN